MKTSTTVYAKILWLFLFVVLTIPFLNTLAQSGKVIPAPPAKPTPSPEAAAPNQAETNRKLVIESADTYKHVFPTSPGVDNFGEQLNRASVDIQAHLSGLHLETEIHRKADYSSSCYS